MNKITKLAIGFGIALTVITFIILYSVCIQIGTEIYLYGFTLIILTICIYGTMIIYLLDGKDNKK